MRARALLLLLASGCYARMTGVLAVDGTSFAAQQCRSGAPLGYSGVGFVDEQGRFLRLDAHPDGTCSATLFAPNQSVGDPLGACGTLAMSPGVGVINGVRNLEGTATLTCETAQHKVTGQIAFEHCH